MVADAAKLSNHLIWVTPVISSVALPVHAQTSITASCPTQTSNDVIVTAGNIIQYRAGDGAGIWWATIGPVPTGYVAFNLQPTVFGTIASDIIFWEVSFDGGASFVDVSSQGITNGQTIINQETAGNVGPTPAIPDTENQTGLIFRVNVTRDNCLDNIQRSVTFNIVASNLLIDPFSGPVPQFAQSWDISYTSLDANLNPMGSAVSLPVFSA